MSGEKAVQINIGTIRLYLGVMVSILILISMFWGGGAVAAQWMTSTAEVNFDHRVDEALTPPSGDIYQAISAGVLAHEKEQANQFKEIEIELAEQRVMLTEVHRIVTAK